MLLNSLYIFAKVTFKNAMIMYVVQLE